MKHTGIGASVAFCLAMVSACGGGSGDASTTEPGAVVASTSQTVGASGGTVSLQGLSLALPAAALTSPADLSLQQETVEGPALARFRFSPAGQTLAVPATLRYAAPALPANTRFFWEVSGERWMLPGSVSAGVLTAQIGTLGYNASGSTGLALAASATERVAAAASRVLAQSAAEDTGGSVVVAPVDCEVQVTVLKLRMARAARDGDPSRAAGVFQELQATREVCASTRVQEVQQASCDALAVAQANASVQIASTVAAFRSLTVPLYTAEGFVQQADASCSNVDMADNEALVASKFEQLLDVLRGQITRAEAGAALKPGDIDSAISLSKMCMTLDLGVVCDRLQNQLLPDLIDGVRASAFEQCRAQGKPLPLSQFYALGSNHGDLAQFYGAGRFTLAAVEEDLSFCSDPALHLKVLASGSPPTELSARSRSIRPLVGLGNYNNTGSIDVPRDGSLALSGQVDVLRCADGNPSGADLVVRISGQAWRRIPAVGATFPLGTASSPLLLNVADALSALGIDPASSSTVTVRINREGGACSDKKKPVLDTPFTLFAATVTLFDTPVTPPVPAQRVSWAGELTVTERFTMSWDEIVDPAFSDSCAFIASGGSCRRTQQGSLTGSTQSVFSIEPTPASVPGTTLSLSQTLQSRSGSLTRSSRSSRAGTQGECSRSGEGSFVEAGSVDDGGQTLRAWVLRVDQSGNFLLLPGQHTTPFAMALTSGSSTDTIGTQCTGLQGSFLPAGTTSFTATPGPTGSLSIVSPSLQQFTAQVNPEAPELSGSGRQTLTFTGSRCASELTAVPVMASSSFNNRPTASTVSCSMTVDVAWRLVKQ